MVNIPTINLTSEDMQANGDGNLSKAQIQLLHRHRLAFLAGTFGFAGLFAALLIILFLKISFPSFANRGELFLWIPLILFWLWLLRLSPVRWHRTSIDLREGKIARVDGRVLCRWDTAFGVIQFPRYKVQVGGQTFHLSSDEFFQFTNQGYYEIVYSPQSKVFLGAVPGADKQASAAETLPQIVAPGDASDLLSQRELEILKLLAMGLSNKEIAGQLSLSVNTIKMYSSQIYKKLGVSRRTEAVAMARDRGIL